MKKNIFVLCVFAALLAVSCEKNQIIDELKTTSSKTLWEAEIPSDIDDTRTSISAFEGKVTWLIGDNINYYRANQVVASGTVIKRTPDDKRATIESTKLEFGIPYFAFYPADNIHKVYTTATQVSFTIPSTQSGLCGDANIMAAKVVDGSNNLKFKNLAAIFCFKITDPNVSMVTMIVGGSVDDTLTGVEAEFDEQGKVTKITPNAGSGYGYCVRIPRPGTYFVAVCPKSIAAKDLKVSCFGTEGNILYSFTYPKALDVKAGQLYNWGYLDENRFG